MFIAYIMVYGFNRMKGLILPSRDSSTTFVEQLPLFVLITLLVGSLVVTKLWHQLYVNADFVWPLLRICHLKQVHFVIYKVACVYALVPFGGISASYSHYTCKPCHLPWWAITRPIATTYGIVRDSILNQSQFFHVIEGLAPDIMHNVLEGVLQYETKELLIYIIL